MDIGNYVFAPLPANITARLVLPGQNLGRHMRYWAWGSVAVCVGMAGCGSVAPPQKQEYAADASDVVKNIRCELRDARSEAPFLMEEYKWAAGVQMDLHVVSSSKADADIGDDIPLVPQAAGLTLSTSRTASADRTATFAFTIDLAKPDEIKCDEFRKNQPITSRLHGNLGVGDWIENVESTYEATRTSPDSVQYDIEFTVEQSAEGGVKITKIPAGAAAFNFGLGLNGSRKDADKLSIKLTKTKALIALADRQKPPFRADGFVVTKEVKQVGTKPKSPRQSDTSGSQTITVTHKTKVPPAPPAVPPAIREKLLDDLQIQVLRQKLE